MISVNPYQVILADRYNSIAHRSKDNIIGRLCLGQVSTKCWSRSCAPDSNVDTTFHPKMNESGNSPAADNVEKASQLECLGTTKVLSRG
mmetsp:Transcript_29757/g.59836  ORF Transcript_29757/g.59836 Transcript_29757/m.59836 type:complete len:89 (-) Transcript_29757:1240-1506(-)